MMYDTPWVASKLSALRDKDHLNEHYAQAGVARQWRNDLEQTGPSSPDTNMICSDVVNCIAKQFSALSVQTVSGERPSTSLQCEGPLATHEYTALRTTIHRPSTDLSNSTAQQQ